MARRRRGIYSRNGWYHARWPFRGSLGTRDYRAAVEEYDRRLRSTAEVSSAEPTKTDTDDGTIAGLAVQYAEKILPIRRCPKAARDAALRLRRAIQPIQKLRPDALRMSHVEAVRIHLDSVRSVRGRPLRAQSIHDHLRDLKGFLRWIARDQPLKCLPFDRGIMPRVGDSDPKCPSPEDLALWLRETREPVRSFSIVLLFSGLRPGELRNLARARLRLTSSPPEAEILASKTRRRRIVYFGQPAVQVLYRWAIVTGASKFICPWRPRNMSSRFAAEAARLGVHLTPMSLRHAWFNLFGDAGGHPEALQRLGGHANVQTTMGWYRKAGQPFVRGEWLRVFSELTLDYVTKDVTPAAGSPDLAAESNR